MSKVLKIVGEVVAIGALAIATAGVGLAVAAGASLGAAVAGAGAIFAGTIGLSLGTALAIGAGLTLAGGLLAKKPQVSPAQVDRTNVNLVVDAPRKLVFGHTALATDLRYQEFWGPNQENCSQILIAASHWCESIDEVWINTDLAWTASGGDQGKYAGYFYVDSYARAQPGNAFTRWTAGWSNRWGANAAFVGCATIYLGFKVTGNDKKSDSPFSSSIPTRITIRGKGARVYDPRLDSSIGGSGPMLASDQSTWAWSAGGLEIGRNPALCLLFYLLGWRIQNPATGAWKLAVGIGVPIDRIDLSSFMTAANMCDEPVTLAAGGTEPRYRCDGMFSEADDPGTVITAIEGCMNAKLRDSAGRFSLQVFHNDLATPVIDLTEDDVLDDFTWDAGGALNDLKNVVKGRYTDPSDASLYQLVDYPTRSLPALDGIDRIDSVDQALVQSPGQAQRLANQRLERYQYPGTFAGNFKARAWVLKDGDVVRLRFPALGFDQKLFRVAKATIEVSGVVPLVLAEEATAIYAWDSSDSAAIVVAPPLTFDVLMQPIKLAIDDAAATANWSGIVDDDGKRPEDNATVGAPIGSKVADRLAEQLVSDLDVNAAGIISQDLRQDDAQTVLDARTFIAGQPVGVVLQSFQKSQTTTNTAVQSSFDLLGAKTADGTGWVLNGASVQIGGGKTLTQSLTDLGATNGDLTAKVATLQTAVLNPDGTAIAAYSLTVNTNGRITGFKASSDGTTGSFSILASRFSVVDDSSGTAVTPFLITNGVVYAPNLVVSNLTVNTAVVPARAASTAELSGPPSFTNVLSVTVHMPMPGWIEAQAGGKQNFTGGTTSTPWSFQLAVNGNILPESFTGGTVPGDSVNVIGAYFAAAAGDYTVNLQWQATSSIKLEGRSLFVKGYANTL